MGRYADALFPSVQKRLLALLFGHPERSFQSSELIRLARGGTGGAHRCLTRLAAAGWLTVERIGNQKHYRANTACPGFAELRALVAKTIGAARAPGRAVPPRPTPPRPAPPRPPREEREEAAAVPEPVREDGWRAW